MTSSQQRADELLAIWQRQALLGTPPEKRKLPTNEEFERELAAIRREVESA